ncbi:MAG: PAS domain S-box protein [Candidatus Cloacimonetes bacterium]|nr:PAS domain S-box protein [Candidatus Cloacimonadota bacterium]
MYLSLLQNVVLLLALSTLYSLLTRLRWKSEIWARILSGILFGVVAIIGMNFPFRYSPGIIYDGRSIILSLAGMFGGGITAALSALIAGVYRAQMGGAGVWAGLATILGCSSLGVVFHRVYMNRPERLNIFSLYIFGICAHIVMLASQLLLQPWPAGPQIISRIWLPILLIFPVVTVLVGLLLGDEGARVRGEKALLKARNYVEKIIQTANVIFVQLDKQGRVVILNEAAEQITGYRSSEIKGKEWFKTLIPEESYPEFWGSYNNLFDRQGITDIFESPILTKSGEKRYIVWQKNTIKDNGDSPGTISFGMDITERRQVEEELIDLKDNLERQVAEKTRELQERIEELEKFYDATIERELRMKELREEIEQLKGDRP